MFPLHKVQRLQILGVPVDCVTMAQALDLVQSRVSSAAQGAYITCANPEKVYCLRSHPVLGSFYQSADLIIPDGIGIVLAARLLYGCKTSRLAGADLMQAICAVAPECGYRIFLFGASPSVNREAAKVLERRHPGIQIVGCEHGYVPETGLEALLSRINDAQPDILFVALGSPRQEIWIQQNLSRLKVKVVQGVGGTLDAITGKVKRAPHWMQAIGLEWFYRLLCQPSRVFRQLNLLRFIAEVITLKASGNPT